MTQTCLWQLSVVGKVCRPYFHNFMATNTVLLGAIQIALCYSCEKEPHIVSRFPQWVRAGTIHRGKREVVTVKKSSAQCKDKSPLRLKGSQLHSEGLTKMIRPARSCTLCRSPSIHRHFVQFYRHCFESLGTPSATSLYISNIPN